MSWWLYTQSDSHSQRVTQALMYHVPYTPKTVPKFEETPQTAQDKLSVQLLIKMVVWETFLKVCVLPENKDDIIQRLFQTIWAKVEGTDVNINSLQNLKRAIFKDLCAMIKDQRLDNCIASIFKDHLTTPPKHLSAICRFFSSEAKLIHKPCRGRPKIGLLVAADSFKRPV